MKKKDESKAPTIEKTDCENTRFLKIGNTTFEISRHYSGTNTYENVVKNAIKREAESG